MTDNKIIKALECCGIDNCDECPCYIEEWGCAKNLQLMALDLINRQKSQILKEQNKNSKLRNERNRQKAEIERLKGNNNAIMQTMADVHTEAIKEFAERLKERAEAHYFDNYCYAVSIEEIDNLVKEMVGEG